MSVYILHLVFLLKVRDEVLGGFFSDGNSGLLEHIQNKSGWFFGCDIPTKLELIQEIKAKDWCTPELIADMERS